MNAAAILYVATLWFPSMDLTAPHLVEISSQPQPSLSHCMIEAERMERVLRSTQRRVEKQTCIRHEAPVACAPAVVIRSREDATRFCPPRGR